MSPSLCLDFQKRFFRPSSGDFIGKNYRYKGRGVEGVGVGNSSCAFFIEKHDLALFHKQKSRAAPKKKNMVFHYFCVQNTDMSPWIPYNLHEKSSGCLLLPQGRNLIPFISLVKLLIFK